MTMERGQVRRARAATVHSLSCHELAAAHTRGAAMEEHWLVEGNSLDGTSNLLMQSMFCLLVSTMHQPNWSTNIMMVIKDTSERCTLHWKFAWQCIALP